MRLKVFGAFFICSLFFFCVEKKQQQRQLEISTIVSDSEEQQFSKFLDSLKQAGATDYQVVNGIRRYLSPKIDRGQAPSNLSKSYYDLPWKSFSGFQCIELFEQNKLTARCGLTSFILAKLYDYAGYRNYIYDCGYKLHAVNFGDQQNAVEQVFKLSHEFNIVELNGNLLVQDAFLNMTIVNSEGLPKDFFQLITEIKTGDLSDIKIIQDVVVSDIWIDVQNANLDEMLCRTQDYMSYFSIIDTVDSRYHIRMKSNYDFLSEEMMSKMRQRFQIDGLTDNFLSIYLKPLYMQDGNTGERADSLFNLISSVVTNSGSPN